MEYPRRCVGTGEEDQILRCLWSRKVSSWWLVVRLQHHVSYAFELDRRLCPAGDLETLAEGVQDEPPQAIGRAELETRSNERIIVATAKPRTPKTGIFWDKSVCQRSAREHEGTQSGVVGEERGDDIEDLADLVSLQQAHVWNMTGC